MSDVAPYHVLCVRFFQCREVCRLAIANLYTSLHWKLVLEKAVQLSVRQTAEWIFFVECKSWSFFFVQFFQPPVTSSLLGPNIFLSTLYSKTLSQCPSINSRYQVSHPYKTTGEIKVLYILPFIFWIANRKTDLERSLLSIKRHEIRINHGSLT